MTRYPDWATDGKDWPNPIGRYSWRSLETTRQISTVHFINDPILGQNNPPLFQGRVFSWVANAPDV